LITLAFMLSGTAFGQSNLPACQGSDATRWSKCTGTYTFADGTKYVGEFNDGKENGQGTYTFANGNKYVGEFKDGYINGQGTKTWVGGDKYMGEWKDDMPNGQGTYTWADGNKYVGELKDGNYNGQGITYSANGSIKQSGIFKDNILITSQYIDPNSFTRIEAKSISSAVIENQQKNTQINNLSIESAKIKCSELGFLQATEGFGKCVLQLTK